MDNLNEALREGLDSVGLVYIDENKDMPRCLLVASLTNKTVSFHGAISILATTIRKKEQSATVLFDSYDHLFCEEVSTQETKKRIRDFYDSIKDEPFFCEEIAKKESLSCEPSFCQHCPYYHKKPSQKKKKDIQRNTLLLALKSDNNKAEISRTLSDQNIAMFFDTTFSGRELGKPLREKLVQLNQQGALEEELEKSLLGLLKDLETKKDAPLLEDCFTILSAEENKNLDTAFFVKTLCEKEAYHYLTKEPYLLECFSEYIETLLFKAPEDSISKKELFQYIQDENEKEKAIAMENALEKRTVFYPPFSSYHIEEFYPVLKEEALKNTIVIDSPEEEAYFLNHLINEPTILLQGCRLIKERTLTYAITLFLPRMEALFLVKVLPTDQLATIRKKISHKNIQKVCLFSHTVLPLLRDFPDKPYCIQGYGKNAVQKAYLTPMENVYDLHSMINAPFSSCKTIQAFYDTLIDFAKEDGFVSSKKPQDAKDYAKELCNLFVFAKANQNKERYQTPSLAQRKLQQAMAASYLIPFASGIVSPSNPITLFSFDKDGSILFNENDIIDCEGSAYISIEWEAHKKLPSDANLSLVEKLANYDLFRTPNIRLFTMGTNKIVLLLARGIIKSTYDYALMSTHKWQDEYDIPILKTTIRISV